MTEGPEFTDASCYHAAFAVLLKSTDERADPVAVIGGSALTGAWLDDSGLLVFGDPLSVLSVAFDRWDLPLDRHRVDGAASWEAAERAMGRGQTVAAAADPFHLPYYWPAYGRSHDLHTVVLRDLDPKAETVRLLDAGEEVFFDARVPLAEVRAAMYADNHGQSWVEVTASSRPPERPAPEPTAELRRLADELAGQAGRWISGTGLVEALTKGLDDYLDAVRDRTRPRDDAPSPHRLGRTLPLGLLWYHHTLRWLARHLELLSQPAETVEAVRRAARDLVVANGLMTRIGILAPGAPRAAAFRSELESRLARMLRDLTAVAAELTGRTGAAL
ncbi:hypothetical protein ACH4TV_29835 [Streptomyces sp. NPDC020898]|uniref:hypothetical protein n=1 Tax=Streptomyces sp. NPDC020898 TaxID=3365101 RepID=UPI0037B4B40D